MAVNEVDILIESIAKWHHDRNLIEGSDDKSQFGKLIQEAGELSDNICKGNDMFGMQIRPFIRRMFNSSKIFDISF